MKYRLMEQKDVDQVSLIEQETFSMPWPKDAFLDMLADEKAIYVVAEEGEEIIGSCGLLNIVGEGSITNVAVKKSARNRGAGRGMLEYLLRLGEEAGISAFTMEVRVSNRLAIRLYEKLGFRSEGVRPNFYERPAEDALIMWKR